MPFTGILLTLIAAHSPFVVDSTIYAVDIHHTAIRQQTLRGNIIDYCIDDFLYILTKRFLYKLDPDNLLIVDRTILPQTYTSMCTNQTKVLLISAGEIVILAKTHLAYETGIGMLFGDIRPLISSQGRTIAPDGTSLYVIEDMGSVSVIKIIDLGSGGIRKALRVPKIIRYTYNASTRTLTTLDIQDRLTTYDLNLKKTGTIKLPFSIDWFSPQAAGFCIGTRAAIYSITRSGTIIDFQPLAAGTARSCDDYVFITDQHIVRIDSLTLRANAVVTNRQGITQLFSIDHPSFVIGMNEDRAFYFIHTATLDANPQIQKESILPDIHATVIPAERDSLWYMQLGAFSNNSNALQMYIELRARAIPVFIDTAEVYRVKLGGFYDKQIGVFIADRLHLSGWFSLQKRIPLDEHTDFFVEYEKYELKDGIITRSNP